MLDGPLAYICKIVKVSMVMVHIGYRREIHSRNLIFHDCEIREIRHEIVNHTCKGICNGI